MCCDKIVLNAKVIIILESPHKDEIKNNPCVPAVGESGKIISEVLLGEKEPIGTLENNPFSLLNTFGNPLQIDSNDNIINEFKNEIESLEYYTFNKYKADLKNIYTKNNYIEIANNYKKRLCHASETHKKLVICGIVAQSYFEYIFEITNITIHNSSKNIINNQKVEIFYIEHPSPKNGLSPWKATKVQDRIQRLKEFIK